MTVWLPAPETLNGSLYVVFGRHALASGMDNPALASETSDAAVTLVPTKSLGQHLGCGRHANVTKELRLIRI